MADIDLTDTELRAVRGWLEPIPADVLDAARGVYAAAQAVYDWRALTVKQPHAFAIVGRPGGDGGPKPVENRSRKTSHRGPILIHAGAAYDHDHTSPAFSQWMRSGRGVQEWTFGAIIGTAVIEDCHQCDGSCSEWAEPDAWHWRLGERRAFAQPIGARGALGLWRPTGDAMTLVLAELASLDDKDVAAVEARIHQSFRGVCGVYAGGTADDELLAGCPLFAVPEQVAR